MTFKNLGLILAIIYFANSEIIYSKDRESKLVLKLVEDDGILLNLSRGNDTKLSAHIGQRFHLTLYACHDSGCIYRGNDSYLYIDGLNSSFNVEWSYSNGKASDKLVFNDCFDLNSTNVSWYGGPETFVTEWPTNKITLENRPYISSKLDNGAVIESYWLNSKGGFILVNETVPLFVDQNNEKNDSMCLKATSRTPFEGKRTGLSYILAARNDAKDAHLYVINNLLDKPNALPNEKMVREPIWTTWGKYKAAINDSVIMDFLNDIYSHNFMKGQIEIDDKWETCYGDQTFDLKVKFRNINSTVKTIHNYGFRATIWTHPFVNTDCSTPVEEGIRNGYLVNSTTGVANSSWWEGPDTYVIDFTNVNASKWFKNKLLDLHNSYGIDGFKCDAGENDWLPAEPIFNRNYSDAPNAFTRLYLEACAELGDLVEVRSAARTQKLGVFVRMLDKDSVWGNNNGLRSLVHSLLQFNMIGYTFVLPDLIGGNGYKNLPSIELLIRWTQANAFMPSLQFSYLPWELSNDPEINNKTTEIVRKFVQLHEEFSDVIIDAMKNSSRYGVPVNPPIWWIDPTDSIAQQIEDEFLVGEQILVAPVLEEGARSRVIYLPKGRWRDGNLGTILEGPIVEIYPAPIDTLPYFIRL